MSKADIETLLRAAFERRRHIAFDYDALPREVVPGAYGPHVTTRNLVLRGYQIGGESRSQTVPFWKLFLIGRMSNLVVCDTEVDVAPLAFNPIGDEHIAPIILKLDLK
ncbi:MAG: hypothetical protein ACJ716_05975 [Marmoricola sp.]